MMADGAPIGLLGSRIRLHQVIQGPDELRTVPIHRHHIGGLRAQPVVDFHLASAGLVQDRHLHAVSKPARSLRDDQIDIGQDRVVADGIVRNVVGHRVDETVVAHGHVVQGRIIQSGVLLQAAGEIEFPVEPPEPDRSGKADPAHMRDFRRAG